MANLTYNLKGAYHYEHEDGEYQRWLDNQCIEDFIEHALMIVRPQEKVKITIEVI